MSRVDISYFMGFPHGSGQEEDSGPQHKGSSDVGGAFRIVRDVSN